MYGLQPMQPLLKLRAQPPIRLGHIRKQRVPTRLGPIQHVQKRRPRRLLLVADVGVPGGAVRAVLEVIGGRGVVGAAVDEMHLRVVFGCARGRVDVVSAEVAAELEGVADGDVGEVLVAECWEKGAEGLVGVWWRGDGKGVKSRFGDVPTTLLRATKRASSSLPLSLSWLS